MPEKEVVIQSSGGLRLEGLLGENDGERAVVVTHPHPLYGGSMRNNVVDAIVEAYERARYTTLRFNFRGVGASQGRHENGVGEQEDVGAALQYLVSLKKKSIDLAGYSFGAFVNCLGIDRFQQAARLIMVAPPVSFVDFGFLERNAKIEFVIAGANDSYGPSAEIERLLPRWNPKAELVIVEEADHFFGNHTAKLVDILSTFLNK